MNKELLLKNTSSYHDELLESLKDSRESYAYLQVALEEYQEDNDYDALLIALKNVASAQGGMTMLAKKTKLNRQNLYRILSKRGNPRLDSFGLIIKALGFKLSIEKGDLIQT